MTYRDEPVAIQGRQTRVLRGGHGVPLVYLHDTFMVHDLWLPLHDHLADGFEVIVPVHPGCEGSEATDIETMEDLVFHDLDLCEALRLERPIVVGASLKHSPSAEAEQRRKKSQPDTSENSRIGLAKRLSSKDMLGRVLLKTLKIVVDMTMPQQEKGTMAQMRGEPQPYESSYATALPDRRPLKIYTSDPMAGRLQRYRISIDIENEPDLEPGPRGDLIEVIDYDSEHYRYYQPVDLNLPAILMQGGLDPNESDPRFHQQMVYAVSMRVIETASRALGRPITFKTRKYPRLRLIPHAFYGANAFFDPKLNAVLFGYFRADETDPGENIPGQNVFTCLSHDIIAHEVTHTIVHRLRRYFLEPSNVDVLAFHEAFSDVVALFQRFSYAEILREHIQSSRLHLQDANMMVDLAQQFGHATGRGSALRSAIGTADAKVLSRTFEPHARGAILVSAIFDGFFRTYEHRIADLVRIATAGASILPAGNLPVDLVNRIAMEASAAADAVLRMCIRAFDYLPPVDVTFGDYLRALVTADYELDPDDLYNLRYAMIEGFRSRGIIPADVTSLAESSLLLEGMELPRLPRRLLDRLLLAATHAMDRSVRRRQRTQRLNVYQRAIIETDETDDGERDTEAQKALYPQLWHYAEENASALGLDPHNAVAIQGFHPVHRIAQDGSILVEFVIQVVQTDREKTERFGGLPLRAGATLVAGADGAVRYVISKPMPSDNLSAEFKQAAERREAGLRSFVALCDARDPYMSWASEETFDVRMLRLQSFRALHGGI